MPSPTLIVTQSFTDADAALAHATTIYNSGIAHLRQSLHDFVAGTTPSGRIRACTRLCGCAPPPWRGPIRA